MSHQLNPSQREAIRYLDGPLLVLAVIGRLRCFLQCGGQIHRPLHIGKPTFAIVASRHLAGMVLIDCFEF